LRTLRSGPFFVLIALFISGWIAQATVPPLFDVPDYLPGDVKKDLGDKRAKLEERITSLRQQAADFNAKCGNRELSADDPLTNECLAEKAKLDKAGQQYSRDAEAFNKEVEDAISFQRVPQQITKLKAQITLDETAIRRLGFEKRASEFAEWENFSEDTKNKFEQEVVQILLKLAIDEAGAVTANVGEDKLTSLTQKDANRWIQVLRDQGVDNQYLFKSLREFASAKNSQARVAALKIFAAATTQATQTALATKSSAQDKSLRDKIVEAFVECAGTAHSPQLRLLAGEVELTSAIVYDSAAQNVSKSCINQMTDMTEDQLKALQKLSKTLQTHVKALNDLKKMQQ
jgi:hypothetical protein